MGRVELHRHLDASFRASTLSEIISQFQISPEYKSDKDIKEKFWITKPMNSLEEVLSCFTLFQKCLVNEAIIERLTRETIEDCLRDNISTVELRYSPSFASELSKLSWEKVLTAIKTGIKNFKQQQQNSKIDVDLICIVSRDYGVEMAEKTIDFAINHHSSFVAVDLAGNENGFPCKLFKKPFLRAKNANLGVTIHAGEGSGSESIWQALDILGAQRIGHGIAAQNDPSLMKRLEKDKIMLELCPTSNWITRTVETIKEHPLPTFLEAGIPISINTDDPGIFGVSLNDEINICQSHLGLNRSDIDKIMATAQKYLFRNKLSV